MTKVEFESLVRGSQANLRSFLVAHCCGDCQLADDIAQETYIKAFLSLSSLKDKSKFKSWLYRIAYTTFINSRRSTSNLIDLTEAEGIAADVSSDSSFNYQELYKALSILSVEARSAILLFYIEGYSTNEISSILGKSESNIRQLLSRGRKQLKSLIEKSE